ncbi:MAG TPA: NAD(P)-dependent oxidoreductase, partial [Anaerolineae bacterium]
MNIVVLSDFNSASQQVIRAAAPSATVHFYKALPIDQLPADVLSSADVLYTGSPLPDPDKAPRLKWVQAHSAGVDHLLSHPLFKVRANSGSERVLLTTASGVHAINISEYIVMMMLAFGHRLPLAFKMKQRGEWDVNRPAYVPAELYGATLGLIGYGAIGRRVAQVSASLGMHVAVLRHHANGESAVDGITFYRRERLSEMLGVCDYVALTAPLTPSTFHMMDRMAFAAMKQSACLINIARGDLVDEAALIDALTRGVILG